ncbi:3D-(3,5/4)-trihydroxycyclohexane-1,2-dione hydrolase [Pelagimonas phthalicica]|uniref:3D-(3,5/4)-trihydroxycyclohexane-1,2-dione hydrolase n=1 Tax=Pelagimonas phthalicica TaxID=1037362 RepID=A0A238JB88_9RHOB|nr:3D-(3,5/4)-trihydroxycyclohexane-1,2-dione acylhydrolase (decyclizing) [Pelagimonas phthalicica]TDS93519.1 3D-(3,5/4)-trihydroxycyclohexane-1,2-dione hydrolase [Pelagimonas phthalicica]SMX27960.1 3D-(3,5/4)-trihydroxycyclohexane-1,2-dione hydrolase [Pelagimonas phthalicica]
MTTIRLTAAQAMVKYLSAQMTPEGERFLDGVWGIFGHGNVCGLGEALQQAGNSFPTWRGQNEQTMAHTAIAYAKAHKRKRAQVVTSSIGPGATNMVTAAALAHVNRIPVLFVPGDVFAGRAPDPVLQQIEDFEDGTLSVNDCFRPVSRYYDRIMRPEQLLTALPRAMRVMTDPAACGPVTLSFCQDTQAEAYDYPVSFFEPRTWHIRRPEPDARELAEVAEMIKGAERPVIVAGGGVIYSEAEEALGAFSTKHGIPFIETQSGKGALPQSHEMNFGASGVDGSAAANKLSEQADLVIGVGTRFQDFTTGSWSVFKHPDRKIISINVQGYDAQKHGSVGLVSDARIALEKLTAALGDTRKSGFDPQVRLDWLARVDEHCRNRDGGEGYLPIDAEVIGAVQRTGSEKTVAMCAAGTMPGALKLLWQASAGGYHMEYGFSCMGYEVAGAMGLKLAQPERDVICFTGDGSYMMANSELATAVMRKVPFTVVLTDNRGFGCINRLQTGTGGQPFNNLYEHCNVEEQPEIDFVAHAAAMGAKAMKAKDIADLEAKLTEAKGSDIPVVIVIDTDPWHGPTEAGGGAWWDVGIPEVSNQESVRQARANYDETSKAQRAD